MKANTSFLAQLFNILKSLFVSGLLTILPLAITVGLFAFVLRTVKHWFRPVYEILPEALKAIPLSEFIVVIIAIAGLGAVLRFLLLHPIVEILEGLLGKVPLVRQVYFGIKQLVNAFSPKDDQHFRKVVLVEFPRKGVYSLGFLTSESYSALPQAATDAHGQELTHYNVFVPHTPNPTSGFFILVPATDCTFTTLSRQEAMTIIISGGIIQPDRLYRK